MENEGEFYHTVVEHHVHKDNWCPIKSCQEMLKLTGNYPFAIMNFEDRATQALPSAEAQGDTNLTQPSAGEQPTSVEGFDFEAGGEHEYVCITHKPCDLLLSDYIAEERRQAKIAVLENLLKVDCFNDAYTTDPRPGGFVRAFLKELKLRGENNE